MSYYGDDSLSDDDFFERQLSGKSRFYREEIIRVGHPIYDPEKVWDFVGQTKVWRNHEQEDLKISKMTEKQHLFNILKWADDNYGKINFTLETASELGFGKPELVDIFHKQGILALPLFIRIKERYIKLLGK